MMIIKKPNEIAFSVKANIDFNSFKRIIGNGNIDFEYMKNLDASFSGDKIAIIYSYHNSNAHNLDLSNKKFYGNIIFTGYNAGYRLIPLSVKQINKIISFLHTTITII